MVAAAWLLGGCKVGGDVHSGPSSARYGETSARCGETSRIGREWLQPSPHLALEAGTTCLVTMTCSFCV